MKIIDILKNKRVTLSFEVFPPKTADAVPTALVAAEAIAALHPDFMSVTYGAGGGTSDFTVHIASAVRLIKMQALKQLWLYAVTFPPTGREKTTLSMLRI